MDHHSENGFAHFTPIEVAVSWTKGYHLAILKKKRGWDKGDPLSAYLFILITELLTRAINKCQDIKGIIVNNVEIKWEPSADNTTAFLKDIESVGAFLRLLEDFCKISGL